MTQKAHNFANITSNRWITYNKETKTLTQWALDLRISSSALRYRLRNWSIEEALTTPQKLFDKMKKL